MMNHFRSDIVQEFALRFRSEIAKRRSLILREEGRFPKRQIFIALNGCKQLFADKTVASPKSRWSVGKKQKPRDVLVLEYLLDYSISNFSIPQAIDQKKKNERRLSGDQNYHLLLTVESEFGNNDEVARDFLKLLDVRSAFRCLIYAHRPRSQGALSSQLEWVIAHHGCYDSDIPIILIALPRYPKSDFMDRLQFFQIIDKKLAPLRI